MLSIQRDKLRLRACYSVNIGNAFGSGKVETVVDFHGDYDAIRAYHKEMNCVCFENTAMGLYFINDPDDYWIEVLPQK